MLSGLARIVENEYIENMPEAICGFLSTEIFSNVMLVDLNMKKIVHAYYNDINSTLEPSFASLDLKKEYIDRNRCVFPLKSQKEYTAALILYKEDIFSENETALIKEAALVLSISMLHIKVHKSSLVKSAISTLSYSELEAVLAVFEDFSGNEALIIASKIADKKKITRSVIVNALRKLESAGIIESRSLGMKGTYIKLINSHLLDELKKFRS